MTVVFYVSSHGLGHATRSIEVLKALDARRPDARLIVRTAAPAWIFHASAPARVERSECETDVGVVQVDSLNVDEAETAVRAVSFYDGFERRVEAEAAWLAKQRASIVLGDIPPLAFAAAVRAGVPSVAIGNFTWDWIYGGYGFGAAVIDTIRSAYATATRALRLPLHGGFEAMRAVTTDIPFVARRSARDPSETRERLGVARDRPFVLAGFSGGDLAIPYRDIAGSEGLTVVAHAREVPPPLTYPDLVAAADAVVGKPGYGIVSECIANGTPLLYTSRGRFAEYDVFVEQMPRVLRCRHLPRQDFLEGRWRAAIDALLAQPPPPETPRVDGAGVAAQNLMELLAS